MTDRDDNLDFGFEIPEDALEQIVDPETTKKWPQTLTDMLTVVAAAFRHAGSDDETARARAFVAVQALAEYHGGHIFYLPKGKQLARALRDRRIWEAHNGSNVAELANRFGLNEVQIYRILAEQRKLARSRTQPDLFEQKGQSQ